MAYSKEEILKDYKKVSRCINSIDNKNHILACLTLVLLFMKKHPDYVILSLVLQTNLKVKEVELRSFPKASKDISIIREAKNKLQVMSKETRSIQCQACQQINIVNTVKNTFGVTRCDCGHKIRWICDKDNNIEVEEKKYQNLVLIK